MGSQAAIGVLFLLMGALIPAPASAQADPPRCFGQPATIIGTNGDDRLEGTDGPDVIVGRKGRDTILGRGGNDVICGGPNPLGSVYGDPVRERILGGRGNDLISGGKGRDEVLGGGGDDDLRGNQDPDVMYGGNGRDRILGNGGWDNISSFAARGHRKDDHDVVLGGPGNDDIHDPYGRNVLRGGRGSDRVTGGLHADRLYGGAGRDILAGADGDDMLDGGPGRDAASWIFDYAASSATGHSLSLRVDLSRGSARGMGFDRLSDIEDVWSGGGADRLVGDANANVFYVGLTYEGGIEDIVSGKGGRDTLTFDTGVTEGTSCGGPVLIDLGTGSGTWDNSCNDISSGVEFSSIEGVIGSGEADVIWGNARINRLLGLSGDDELYGRGRDDHLDGGEGEDYLDGGPGRDTCLNGETTVRCE